jgi:hypothetical protein
MKWAGHVTRMGEEKKSARAMCHQVIPSESDFEFRHAT